MMTHMLCATSSSIDETTSGIISVSTKITSSVFYFTLLTSCLCLSALPDALCNLDIPVIDMELDGIFDLPHIAPFRNSVALLESTGNKAAVAAVVESEEESESTVL